MAGTYSIVRPYAGHLGAKVQALISSLGRAPALGSPPAAGTSDEHTARWISRSVAQLLVVPFHFHRGPSGERLDGIGVLLSLPKSFDLRGRVVFMPVREFSWATSFQPRYSEFLEARPQFRDQLIVAGEEELDSAGLSTKLKRALDLAEGQRSSSPPALPRRSPTLPPGALPMAFGQKELPVSRRSSGGWKFNLPPEPEAPAPAPLSGVRAISSSIVPAAKKG